MTSSTAHLRVVEPPATDVHSPHVEVPAPHEARVVRPAGPDATGKPEPIPARSPADLRKAAARDHRLDFWRGLCLVDMLLVHLIHQGMSLGRGADLWVGEYTRFAAGGFVFIAGLSVARIFLPKAKDPDKRWGTYTALWKRAGVILLVHYVAEVGFLVMWPTFGGVAFRPLWEPIWSVLTFRTGYDLLPFYVVMMALAPGMLELLRRGRWLVLAAASAGLFYAGHFLGLWKVALPIQQAFFPVLWQAMFVAGMLGGLLLPRYDALARGAKVGVLLTAVAAHLVLFVAYYGPNFGLHLWLPMAFQKVPLTTGEALRYLTLMAALMVGTDLLWRDRLATTGADSFCERLGRNSLAVYVFHVWVVQLLVRTSAWAKLPTVGRIGLAVAGVLLLWAFARLLEGRKVDKKAGGKKAAKPAAERGDELRVPWPLRPIGGLAALAIVSVVGLVVANVEQAQYTDRTYVQRPASPNPGLFPPDQSLPEIIPDPDDGAEEQVEEEDPFGAPDPQGPLFHQPNLVPGHRIPAEPLEIPPAAVPALPPSAITSRPQPVPAVTTPGLPGMP